MCNSMFLSFFCYLPPSKWIINANCIFNLCVCFCMRLLIFHYHIFSFSSLPTSDTTGSLELLSAT